MKNTTLCYIENEKQYLMLHRTKKLSDPNEGKWIGVGGHFEENEAPEDCLLREVKEETGLTLTNYTFRGLVTFVSDEYETEIMHLFTANKYEGQLTTCNEGELAWIDKSKIFDLNLWEGDKIFLKLLLERNQENNKEDKTSSNNGFNNGFFTCKLTYTGDKLVSSEVKYY